MLRVELIEPLLQRRKSRFLLRVNACSPERVKEASLTEVFGRLRKGMVGLVSPHEGGLGLAGIQGVLAEWAGLEACGTDLRHERLG